VIALLYVRYCCIIGNCLLGRRHYTESTYLQLLERLVAVLYPLNCDQADLMPLKIAELYEMVVTHSAFLPSMLSSTSADVKGEDLAE